MGCFWPKYIMYIMSLKKYRGVIFDCTEDWCKIWRKTGLYFLKWLEEFGKFSPKHVRKSKNWTFTGSFYPKQKMYELKIYRGVMCQQNEERCKIWRELDLSIQKWYEEFDEFWPEHSKISKIWTLMSCFWLKYVFELKKVQRS